MLPPFGAFEFPYPKTCHVYLNGTQTIQPGVLTIVTLNAILWDTYNFSVNLGSNVITIPEDGLYFINMRIQSTTVVNAPIIGRIYRNGVFDMGYTSPPNNVVATIVAFSYMNMLNKGDTLDERVQWNGSGTIDIGSLWNNVYVQVLKLPYITKGY